MTKIPRRVKELVKEHPPGIHFTNKVCCQNCHHAWVAVYERTPLKFACPKCGRRAGVRVMDEDLPVDPHMEM